MYLLSNKVLLAIVLLLAYGAYQVFKPPLTKDALVCDSLARDPARLPFISYSNQAGFDACVSRCMTNVMMQVCKQLPSDSNVFSEQPHIQQQMMEGCVENIKYFVSNQVRCPYLHCEP